MGLSASQARLLSLTSRLSDLEYRSQLISNEKIAMSRDSEAASDAYSAALSQQTIKVKDDDETNTYVTATAANLTTYNAISDLEKQRMLKTNSGEVIVSQDTAKAYLAAKSTAQVNSGTQTLDEYLAKLEAEGSIAATSVTTTSQTLTTYSTKTIVSTVATKTTPDTDGDNYYSGMSKSSVSTLQSELTNSTFLSQVQAELAEGNEEYTAYNVAELIADNVSSKSTTQEVYYGVQGNSSAYKAISFQDSNSLSNEGANFFSDSSTYWISLYNTYQTAVANGADAQEEAEKIAKRVKYFEELEEGTAGEDVLSPEEQKKFGISAGSTPETATMNVSDEYLDDIDLTDTEKASAGYLVALLGSMKANNEPTADGTCYLQLKAYQEAYANAVADGIPVSTDENGSPVYANSSLCTTYSTVATSSTVQSVTTTYNDAETEYYTEVYNGLEGFLNNFGYTSNEENTNDYTYDKSAISWYEEVFEQMDECGYEVVSDDCLNNADWLYDQLSAGNIYLSEQVTKNGETNWQDVSWSSGDNEITTAEASSTDTAKAEAEYEKTTAEISAKEEKMDLQLKNIDTEHSAIQTEVESVQKVIDKNIERSFKMFDA